MKRFYNDFYQSFGRTVHDLQEQQVRDIVEYAENGLSENEIVLLTDMDRRRVHDIIGHIKPIQEEILMEKPLFRVFLKFANSADHKKAQKYVKTANIKGMKVDYNYSSTNLLIVFDNIDSAFKDKRQFLDWIKKGKFKFKIDFEEEIEEETQLDERLDSIIMQSKGAKDLEKIAKSRGKGNVEFKGGKLTLDDKSAQIILDIIAQEEKWPQYQLRDAIKNPKSYTSKDVIKLVQLAKKAQGDKRPMTQVK